MRKSHTLGLLFVICNSIYRHLLCNFNQVIFTLNSSIKITSHLLLYTYTGHYQGMSYLLLPVFYLYIPLQLLQGIYLTIFMKFFASITLLVCLTTKLNLSKMKMSIQLMCLLVVLGKMLPLKVILVKSQI